MGCDQLMFKKNISLKNIHKYFVLALVLFSLTFISVSSIAMSYTPAKPDGPEAGIINKEYRYRIVSAEPGSRWIFDWGDGTFSPWITFNSSSYYNFQKHSYSNPGVFQIRVKYKDEYDEESKWSPPLNVSIYTTEEDLFLDFFQDTDGDGWSNIVETFCGTNMYNPQSYPLDTDQDGLPDETQNNSYIADIDDDNDGLEDVIEINIGSNPKDSSDVRTVEHEDDIYFLVDTDGDNKIDKFYVKYSGETTEPLDYDEGMNLKDSLNKKIGIEEDSKDENNGSMFSVFNFPIWGILVAVFIVLFLIFVLFKTGILYLYEEELEE